MQRVAIMGGTFDPIHYGHLVTAEEAFFRYSLNRVVFVPSGQPPHKLGQRISSAADRYMMTVLATMSNPHFEVSSIETDRPGPSYAVDTVRAFRELYPDDTKLYFITGADAILEIFGWKDAHTLLQLCDFVAATRPGYTLPVDRVEETFGIYASRIQFFEVPALAISSTDIRRRVREGRPIRYLLPESVSNYIYKAGLYQDERNAGPAHNGHDRAAHYDR
ncbi:MAG: nicotinate-nucleotide adenylyltransferase [Firmicutes bacterium]|jgi:nicotinate-nucleotide adenylyltransferase|nr:nicotinate-nucleotide adenylyltransferase [Bacillota bacterium]